MVTRRALARSVVLDSSCWLEHFADSDRAALFAPALVAPAALIVPVITVYEVIKKISRELGDEIASQALSLMHHFLSGAGVSALLPACAAAMLVGEGTTMALAMFATGLMLRAHRRQQAV